MVWKNPNEIFSQPNTFFSMIFLTDYLYAETCVHTQKFTLHQDRALVYVAFYIFPATRAESNRQKILKTQNLARKNEPASLAVALRG